MYHHEVRLSKGSLGNARDTSARTGRSDGDFSGFQR